MAERQFSSLYIGEALFGIDILLIREINKHLEITPVDQAPDFVRGLLNLRGQVITVLDLGIRLGMGALRISKASRCVILKTSSELSGVEGLDDNTCEDVVGLLVDRVGDVVGIDTTSMEPPPANVNGVDSRYMQGVVKLEDDLMVVINVGEVLRMEDKT
ncbi:chemotaxis protein CheW [Fibrobacterota bacterium]